ncbi:MAG: hypothetical protein D3904_00915 [Candidatus Electrothrix sp. EH2]|nr:hypothetical protein [Candidatus Electrothrix sp. EH2]
MHISRKIQQYFANLLVQNPKATVAVNMEPVHGPWGGSSVFIRQLTAVLRQLGFIVRFDLRKKADVLFIIDPRVEEPGRTFGLEEIIQYKKHYPDVKVIHRVNECDQRKNTDFMDDRLEKISSVVDYTIFISRWLRDYFIARWFDPARPHTVIYNGADPDHFHPVGSARYIKGEKLRLVTHHWSANPMKGFPLYATLDQMIASGELEGFEFWIIGNWPTEIQWKATKIFPPVHDAGLAKLLRQCHLYITASLWEPCGAHHVEGAQCGLPLVYHKDGGGIVEAGKRYGLSFDEGNLKDVLMQAKKEYPELRQQVLARMPNGLRMCCDFAQTIQTVLA